MIKIQRLRRDAKVINKKYTIYTAKGQLKDKKKYKINIDGYTGSDNMSDQQISSNPKKQIEMEQGKRKTYYPIKNRQRKCQISEKMKKMNRLITQEIEKMITMIRSHNKDKPIYKNNKKYDLNLIMKQSLQD